MKNVAEAVCPCLHNLVYTWSRNPNAKCFSFLSFLGDELSHFPTLSLFFLQPKYVL